MPDKKPVPVAFGELPAPGRRRTTHSLIAAQLRQRPGEWALIATRATPGNASSTAQAIRTARLSSYAPRGAFESAARTEKGVYGVYARYVGEEKPGE